MLALSSSHRGVRLHTFEPEDRVYTSTPTKIGGHCLDHVRNGLVVWGGHSPDRGGCDSRPAASFNHEGRFGGLRAVVLKLEPPSPGARRRRAARQPPRQFPVPSGPPLPISHNYLAPADLLPDTATSTWPGSWQREEHGPHWPDDGHDGFIVAPPSFHGASPQHGSAASRHAGALLAVLLSKLANGGDSPLAQEQALDAVAHSPAITTADTASGSSSADLLHLVGAVEFEAQEALSLSSRMSSVSETGAVGADRTAADAAKSVFWAWNVRLAQAPSHSKLRRYIFVRELGKGSHGTILLVKKKRGRGCGGVDQLRVLKESRFLSEAVNEARLLLVANGGGNKNSSSRDGGNLENMSNSESRDVVLGRERGQRHAVRVSLAPKDAEERGGVSSAAGASGEKSGRGGVVEVRK